MAATPPAPSLEALRARVVTAFAELPPEAFEQALTWLAGDTATPFRVSMFRSVGMQAFRHAVAGYFAAKRDR